MTVADLITAYTADPAKVAADAAAVAAAQAAQTTDQATEATDLAALVTALAAGPVSVVDTANPPQFVTVYTAAAAGSTPPFTTQTIPTASSVTVPPAAPTPTSSPSS
jgi:hypothetical protein